jgi:hypothetical protein
LPMLAAMESVLLLVAVAAIFGPFLLFGGIRKLLRLSKRLPPDDQPPPNRASAIAQTAVGGLLSAGLGTILLALCWPGSAAGSGACWPMPGCSPAAWSTRRWPPLPS